MTITTRLTEPITDRTLSDIRARNYKAFWNVVDWYRVYYNIGYLSRFMAWALDYPYSYIFDDENGTGFWANTDPTEFPVVGDVPRYGGVSYDASIQSIGIILAYAGIPAAAIPPAIYSFPNYINYSILNIWESNTFKIMEVESNILQYRVYSGVSNCGQSRFFQNHFRTSDKFIEDSPSPVRRPQTGIAISGAGITRNNYFRRRS